MRKTAILSVASLLWGVATLCEVQAQECDMPVAIVLDKQTGNLPETIETQLENALNRLATSSGMSADTRFTNLILTARVDVLDKSILPGPPMQVSTQLGVTIYLGNATTQTKYASAYVEIAGVGNNENKCLADAFRHLNANGKEISRMIATGRKKMIDYYDNHYDEILKEAKRMAGMQQYEEAIALAASIPSCSKGYEKAIGVGLELYMKNFNRLNLSLLNRAHSIWASGGDGEAGRKAGHLLAQIDPDADCYPKALALMTEIKSQIRSNIDFEMRKKYNDSVTLEKKRIESMQAIGVALGKGQQPQTTNLTWLK